MQHFWVQNLTFDDRDTEGLLWVKSGQSMSDPIETIVWSRQIKSEVLHVNIDPGDNCNFVVEHFSCDSRNQNKILRLD